MLLQFFTLAAQSSSRQAAFRRAVAVHIVVLAFGSLGLRSNLPNRSGPIILGMTALILGIVEGATLVGWRLTQLPKSQALEFLLVSPLRPRRLFLAEAVVGLVRFALVTLCGLPLLAGLAAGGCLDPLDVPVLLIMPFTWGAITGIGLTVWAYEQILVRRWGERLAIGLIVVYLLIGVLAGEHLKEWLAWLPDEGQRWFFNAFLAFHRYNPFQQMRSWMELDAVEAWEPMMWLQIAALGLFLVLVRRGAGRLQPHFHELHYLPQVDPRAVKRQAVSDRPLSWWAVRRVMRYSGRINFWLIGGFGIVYSLYILAGPLWPNWMGRAVFALCDQAGGVGMLTAALVILAAVPAAFQYGLWDSNSQDRCRRLELLLLTDLGPRDYWEAAAGAAWMRGRGYFGVAGLLWTAALLSGNFQVVQVLGAAAAGVVLWGLYFVLGFRAFSRGMQANGLGLLLTIGVPLLAYKLHDLNWPVAAGLLPPASVRLATESPLTWSWAIGPLLAGGLALGLGRFALNHCDQELRRWYDAHHGRKVMM